MKMELSKYYLFNFIVSGIKFLYFFFIVKFYFICLIYYFFIRYDMGGKFSLHFELFLFFLGLSDSIIQILIPDLGRRAIPKIKNNKRWRVNNKALRAVNECSYEIYVNNTIKDLIAEWPSIGRFTVR